MSTEVVESVRLLPLGGLGEIGMNCLAVECDGQLMLIDCGVSFPERELGADVIHPDFAWIAERRDRLRAIVVTHGHEDHIGALPYLLRQATAPIYAPPYAMGLLKLRFEEHTFPVPPELRLTEAGRPFAVGPIEIEPFRVTHSIPDSTGLVLRTPAGVVVHSGDFKIDLDPPSGERFDEERLRAIGDEGVRLLLSDSTNSHVDGSSGGERGVAEALERLVEKATNRVVVAQFASNAYRLRAILEIARRTGRSVVLLGRSAHNHLQVALERGIVSGTTSLLLQPEQARNVRRDRLLVVATGTQGEAPSALARLARDDHRDLALEAGDDVVLSSRIIPGYELRVHAMIDELVRRGVRVHHWRSEPDIHVSGHACREEQRRMIELVRPQGFLPVHGTLSHLLRHAELAREMGVDDTLVVEDGALVEVDARGMRVVDHVAIGRVHIDSGQVLPEEVLHDRQLLASLGLAVVIVQRRRDGRLGGVPEVFTRGVVPDGSPVVGEARDAVEQELSHALKREPGLDDEEVESRARRAMKRIFLRELGRKPLCHAVIVEVP